MRKINFLKAALGVAAAMLISVGVYGQVQPVTTPYDVFNADVTNGAGHNDVTDYVTLKGAGTTMGYYALPDPVYHPNYVSTGTLTNGFTWVWTDVAHPGASVPTITPGVAGSPDLRNYATILFPALGVYSITVAESNSSFSCTGSPTYLNTTVIDPPTGTISILPTGWTEIAANQSYQICAPAVPTTETVTISFVETLPLNLASYSFQITETIELLDGTGAVITPAANAQSETVIEDFDLTHKVKGIELDGSDATALAGAAFAQTAANNFAFTFTSASLAVRTTDAPAKNARTRYTYRVTRSGDAAQNGFVSNISQKSDYLSALNYYNFTNQTVSFIVNPAPATGPIYYIPNNFNY